MLLPRWADTRIKKLLERKGYTRVRGEDGPALARRQRLLESHGIDLVVDVGANEGQYGSQMRALGYAGRIHSFEPMQKAWEALQKHVSRDARWSASQLALGEKSERLQLHIAGNSVSSSLLDMLPKHKEHSPTSQYVYDETVRVSRLDDEFAEIRGAARRIWLKLDVQGYEEKVLAGGQSTLEDATIVQLELSLTQLYAGQTTFLPLCTYLIQHDFELVGIEAGFQEKTSGVLLQVDGLFRKQSSQKRIA